LTLAPIWSVPWGARAFSKPPRCTWPYCATIRLLISRGADLEQRDFPDNAAPLHFAAAHGDLDTIRLLVEAGSDLEGKGDDHEVGVLGWATFQEVRQDAADHLIVHGALLNLSSAIALDKGDVVRAMLARDPGYFAPE